jgi:DNA-directed RNA polymerase specialized sigma24 family protein
MDIVCHEIKRLTPPQQDVIERHYLMEQKVADIERALHINSQSVIDRRDRALATLRMRLRNNPFAVELFNQLEDSDDFPLLKKLYKP